ncbi:MAG: PEGA domain-containing protein [Myxococcales bacterium]|nr:PEGA domain-containing protein [Myxococcales bacterium]
MKIASFICRVAVWVLALTLSFGASLAAAQTCPQAKAGRKYKVKVDSAPPGATVYVNSKECGPAGVTPWAGTLTAGSYTVIVELEGYTPASKPFTVKRARAVQELFVPLVKKADPPRIDVRADADKNLFGAQLYVDGELQGQIPMLVNVEPGRHQVEIRKEGFETLTQWITARENDKITLAPSLRELAKAKYGTVVVEADVPDAEVLIDGNKHPDKTPAVISNVIEGIHVIEVRKEPAVPWKQTIQVKANEQTKVRAELKAGMGGAVGTISVLSNISGAKVFLDGREVGVVPFDIKDVKPGEHVVEVKAAGYQTREERVVINAGSTEIRKMDLTPEMSPNQGTIKVVSPVPEAEVFIDGAGVGKVPQEKRAAAGEHFVVVKLPGYKSFEQKVRLEAGQSLTVSAELKAVGRLRILSNPLGASVMINGMENGKTPLDTEVEVGETVVRIEKPGYNGTERTVTIEGGKTETISADLMVSGPSEAESSSEQRGLSSYSARTLPRNRATIDMISGYPYYMEGRINVGFGRMKQFGFDAGVGVRTLFARSEIGLGARLQFIDSNPLSVGAFTDLWWGSALLDDSKRNGVTWNLGAAASLTALSKVTITGRLYANIWSDRHCPELNGNTFDGEPIETCERYLSRAINNQTPNDFTQEDRLRAEALTELSGRDFFNSRESGARMMVSIAGEVALYQHWNLLGILEIAPFQDERALFTNLFSRSMPESDLGIYLRLGATYKF